MGRLKSYKYKKSAYGGKKSPAHAGKKGLAHKCYALHDNQDYTGSCFCFIILAGAVNSVENT